MARHAVDSDRAFEMLRDHTQHNDHKLVDIAQAIVDSHLLLLPPAPPTCAGCRPPGLNRPHSRERSATLFLAAPQRSAQ